MGVPGVNDGKQVPEGKAPRRELHLAFLELGCAVICQRMLSWP